MTVMFCMFQHATQKTGVMLLKIQLCITNYRFLIVTIFHIITVFAVCLIKYIYLYVCMYTHRHLKDA